MTVRDMLWQAVQILEATAEAPEPYAYLIGNGLYLDWSTKNGAVGVCIGMDGNPPATINVSKKGRTHHVPFILMDDLRRLLKLS